MEKREGLADGHVPGRAGRSYQITGYAGHTASVTVFYSAAFYDNTPPFIQVVLIRIDQLIIY